ncbi:putative DNA-binding domain-containing protein [Thermomonas sp. S9]|uniref:HvfC/BufC family peptide modification chaperone n=1 Tax=Thermomonas sp. S9 TaxID=2885203 RepID=UPI00216AB93F|nr:putative DNA-binding domain-containing protein [Thermomonas sp. S9]MCR6497004.1 putative DNA-binding domain-containing protein [Thermomonas sp. S9]
MSALHAQLHALAAHVRDPAAHPGPAGIPERRLRVYRELVRNNLDALLGGTFPVLRDTLGQAGWNALRDRFLAVHRSSDAAVPSAGAGVRCLPRERRGSVAALAGGAGRLRMGRARPAAGGDRRPAARPRGRPARRHPDAVAAGLAARLPLVGASHRPRLPARRPAGAAHAAAAAPRRRRARAFLAALAAAVPAAGTGGRQHRPQRPRAAFAAGRGRRPARQRRFPARGSADAGAAARGRRAGVARRCRLKPGGPRRARLGNCIPAATAARTTLGQHGWRSTHPSPRSFPCTPCPAPPCSPS